MLSTRLVVSNQTEPKTENLQQAPTSANRDADKENKVQTNIAKVESNPRSSIEQKVSLAHPLETAKSDVKCQNDGIPEFRTVHMDLKMAVEPTHNAKEDQAKINPLVLEGPDANAVAAQAQQAIEEQKDISLPVTD